MTERILDQLRILAQKMIEAAGGSAEDGKEIVSATKTLGELHLRQLGGEDVEQLLKLANADLLNLGYIGEVKGVYIVKKSLQQWATTFITSILFA